MFSFFSKKPKTDLVSHDTLSTVVNALARDCAEAQNKVEHARDNCDRLRERVVALTQENARLRNNIGVLQMNQAPSLLHEPSTQREVLNFAQEYGKSEAEPPNSVASALQDSQPNVEVRGVMPSEHTIGKVVEAMVDAQDSDKVVKQDSTAPLSLAYRTVLKCCDHDLLNPDYDDEVLWKDLLVETVLPFIDGESKYRPVIQFAIDISKEDLGRLVMCFDKGVKNFMSQLPIAIKMFDAMNGHGKNNTTVLNKMYEAMAGEQGIYVTHPAVFTYFSSEYFGKSDCPQAVAITEKIQKVINALKNEKKAMDSARFKSLCKSFKISHLTISKFVYLALAIRKVEEFTK